MKESKRAMKEHRKKSGSEKNIGRKLKRRCGRCGKEDHINPSCPDNPAVIEKNRLLQEAEDRRKTHKEIKANRNCPTTSKAASNSNHTTSPARQQTPATPTTPITATSRNQAEAQSTTPTSKQPIPTPQQTQATKSSTKDQETPDEDLNDENTRSEWKLFKTGEKYHSKNKR